MCVVMYDMTPTPAPALPPVLRPVPNPGDDPVDDLRYELRTLGERLDARIDRLEDLSKSNLDLAVEAIRSANLATTKKTAAWVGIATAVITTLGSIAVAFLKAGGLQ